MANEEAAGWAVCHIQFFPLTAVLIANKTLHRPWHEQRIAKSPRLKMSPGSPTGGLPRGPVTSSDRLPRHLSAPWTSVPRQGARCMPVPPRVTPSKEPSGGEPAGRHSRLVTKPTGQFWGWSPASPGDGRPQNWHGAIKIYTKRWKLQNEI